MNYQLLKDLIALTEEFENQNSSNQFTCDIKGFREWISKDAEISMAPEFHYEGKENGRSLDSLISTLLVHLGRYAKSYSKAAMIDSVFATQDEFIFLITLKSFGTMSKMDLIKKNVHEKPVGMQIISRLLKNELIIQENDSIDKRSKLISITEKGRQILDQQMDNIRKATKIVSGKLSETEKLHLVQLLTKLEDFHVDIYNKNLHSKNLLDFGINQINPE